MVTPPGRGIPIVAVCLILPLCNLFAYSGREFLNLPMVPHSSSAAPLSPKGRGPKQHGLAHLLDKCLTHHVDGLFTVDLS